MKFLRVQQVSERIGYSVPHIWRIAREGKFPKSIKLGPNATAWSEDEIIEWQLARINERDFAA
jgi:prophage regulatory protein